MTSSPDDSYILGFARKEDSLATDCGVHHPLFNHAGEPLPVLCRVRIKFCTALAALVLFLKFQLVDERAIEVKAQLKRLLIKMHDHYLISLPHYWLDECIGKVASSF